MEFKKKSYLIILIYINFILCHKHINTKSENYKNLYSTYGNLFTTTALTSFPSNFNIKR